MGVWGISVGEGVAVAGGVLVTEGVADGAAEGINVGCGDNVEHAVRASMKSMNMDDLRILSPVGMFMVSTLKKYVISANLEKF